MRRHSYTHKYTHWPMYDANRTMPSGQVAMWLHTLRAMEIVEQVLAAPLSIQSIQSIPGHQGCAL